MKNVETRYKVLDVRECVADRSKPVVLICNEYGKVARRRIEVLPSYGEEVYNTALDLAPGDVINVFETYDYNGLGGHRIDEIEF